MVPPLGPGDVDLNDDGSLVAMAGGFDGDVTVHRVDDGAHVGFLQRQPRPAEFQLYRDTASVAFGPDGRLYAGAMAGPIDVIDPTTVQVVDRLDAPRSYSHNQLAVGSEWTRGRRRAGRRSSPSTPHPGRPGGRPSCPSTDRSPCPILAVAEQSGSLFCANSYGQIIEYDLGTGRITDRRFDMQLGSIGQLAITDGGRELLAFGEDAPVMSRWRLDGTGPITTVVARGQAADTYSPSGEELLVANYASVIDEAAIDGGAAAPDAAVWDVERDVLLDPLDGFNGSWVGPRLLGGSFGDGTVGVYDLDSGSGVPEIEVPPGDGVWYVPEAERTYEWIVEDTDDERQPGVIKAFDSSEDGDDGGDITPDIPTIGYVNSVSATSGGRRIVVTTYVPDANKPPPRGGSFLTTVYDGRSGLALGEPIVGPWISEVSANGTLLGRDRLHDHRVRPRHPSTDRRLPRRERPGEQDPVQLRRAAGTRLVERPVAVGLRRGDAKPPR